jgi:uncharacterized cupin superfamily protein
MGYYGRRRPIAIAGGIMAEPWVMMNLSEMTPAADGDSYAYYDLSSALGLDQMRANIFRFRPGDKMEYHSHRRQEELFYILEGAGELVVNGERHPVSAGTLVRLEPAERRQIINPDSDELVWLAVGAPAIDNEWVVHPEE